MYAMDSASPQTPHAFAFHHQSAGIDVDYVDVMEVNQGSPLVGTLMIAGQVPFPHERFGGPLLSEGTTMYLPVFIRRFFRVGFRLARIDLADRSLTYHGPVRGLYFLHHVVDDTVYFYTDIYRSRLQQLRLGPT